MAGSVSPAKSHKLFQETLANLHFIQLCTLVLWKHRTITEKHSVSVTISSVYRY